MQVLINFGGGSVKLTLSESVNNVNVGGLCVQILQQKATDDKQKPRLTSSVGKIAFKHFDLLARCQPKIWCETVSNSE